MEDPSAAGIMLQSENVVLDADTRGALPANHLSGLLYELLDAHVDTIKLADSLEENQSWAAHLDYLRDLQRVGREALARVV